MTQVKLVFFFCQMHAVIFEWSVYMHIKYFRNISVFLFALIFTVISVDFFSHAWFYNEELVLLSIIIRKLFQFIFPPEIGRTWIQNYEKYSWSFFKFTFLTEWSLNNTCKKEKGTLFKYKELTLSEVVFMTHVAWFHLLDHTWNTASSFGLPLAEGGGFG